MEDQTLRPARSPEDTPRRLRGVRPIPTEHAPGRRRRQLAEEVVEHLEQSDVEIDKESRVLRHRPPGKPRG
jgi:hypothetical protein